MLTFRNVSALFMMLSLAGCESTTRPPAQDSTPPDRISTLAASAPAEKGFHVSWTAVGEDGAAGTAAEYDLRLSFTPLTLEDAADAPRYPLTVTPLPGGQLMSADIERQFSGVKYYAALRAIDDAGQPGRFSNIVSVQLHDRDWAWEQPNVLSSTTVTLADSSLTLDQALSIGADGTLLLAGSTERKLRRYSQFGLTLTSWPVAGRLRDVAAFADGRVAVLLLSAPFVEILGAQGDSIAAWGDAGVGQGRLCGPTGLAVDAAGDLFIAERRQNGVRIQKFDAAGHLLKSSDGYFPTCDGGSPLRMVVSAWNTLLLFDPAAQLIREYSLDLVPLLSWEPRGPGVVGTAPALSITTDADGCIYLADWRTTLYQVFRADGSPAGVHNWPNRATTDWEADPATGTVWSVDLAVSDVLEPGGISEFHLRHLSWIPPGS